MTENKSCIACGGQIDRRARFCRHCSSYQGIVLRLLPHASLGLAFTLLLWAAAQFQVIAWSSNSLDVGSIESKLSDLRAVKLIHEKQLTASEFELYMTEQEERVGQRTSRDVLIKEATVLKHREQLELDEETLKILTIQLREVGKPLCQRTFQYMLGPARNKVFQTNTP